MKKLNKIDNFDGEFAFLSNFYPSPIVDGIEFPTVEHYFQAHKTIRYNDFKKIAAAGSPGLAKRLGRSIDLRADWEEVKLPTMKNALRLKFADPTLRAKLIATGDAELIEGNLWHDNTWGDCRCARCLDIPGQNQLGKLLMEVRSLVKEEEDFKNETLQTNA